MGEFWELAQILASNNSPKILPVTGKRNSSPVFTGFRDLDRLTGGLQPGSLNVLASQSSIGRTTLALNVSRNVASQGLGVCYVSLEQPTWQVALRLLAAEAQVDTHRLRMHLTSESEDARIADSVAHLSHIPIYVNDAASPSIAKICAMVRQHNADQGLRFLAIDYLQLIESGPLIDDRIGFFSWSLKTVARELNIPVLAISQLGSSIEQRTHHRPQLSDLKDSGSIEQYADVIMFIHREDKYTTEDDWWLLHPGEPYPINLAEIIIAKNNGGPTGSVLLAVQDRFARFVEAPRPITATPEGVR